jgi:hypothetical protein
MATSTNKSWYDITMEDEELMANGQKPQAQPQPGLQQIQTQSSAKEGWITVPNKKKKHTNHNYNNTYNLFDSNQKKVCIDCKNEFFISFEDLQYLQSRGFHPRKRCKDCSRKNRRRFNSKKR